jgi:phospholipase C
VTQNLYGGTGNTVPAFVAGPYVRRNYVSHVRYSQTSVLRTVELLFGLAPLSVYDAAATPMLDAFVREPVTTAFAPIASPIPMLRNPGTTARR